MLQVNFIKANREEVLKRLAKKHFTESALVDTIISLDDERKKLQFEMDERQSKINSFSKEIGQLMAKGEKRMAEEKKLEVASLKSFLQPVSDQLNIIQ
ncbi:MAG TPA: serine--tRNA ligase, partial [Hanamia sp.]|nr:serine--tRNA ligase [Hanamia sp.]